MPIDMLTAAFELLCSISFEQVKEKLKKREKVIEILQKLGFSEASPKSFQEVYIYTLVEYGVGKPKPLIDFFRSENIKNAFQRSFEEQNQTFLHEEAEHFLNWSKIGETLMIEMDYDPRREFAQFTAAFNRIADSARTVNETKEFNKLDNIHDDIQKIMARLEPISEIKQLRTEIENIQSERRSYIFINATTNKLKVFISSRMAELRDVREIVSKSLRDKGIDAFLFEDSVGAQPDSVLNLSLQAVNEADIYVGIFWKEFGEITATEYRHALRSNKPCFVYIRDKDIKRSEKLESFITTEVANIRSGVTYDFFDSAIDLSNSIGNDILGWLVRNYRELSAQVNAGNIPTDEISRLQAEVERLKSISQIELPSGEATDDLGRQLREWFKAIGYGIEKDVIRNNVYADMIINIPTRKRYTRVMVRAFDGEIEVKHVRELENVVSESNLDEGWFICERRLSKAAREEAEKTKQILVYTFDELIDEQADFSNYFEWLEKEVKEKRVSDYYVPLGGHIDDLSEEGATIGTSTYDNIEKYLNQWLDSTDKEHISILGEFGTGKTWLTLHYAYTMMKEYEERKKSGRKRPRIPLLIQLRNYAQGFKDVGSLLSEFVFREHEIGLPGYTAFEQLNRMGRLVLIFDGFDEMASRVDRQKMVNNFWELAKVIIPGSKVILTCRTEHFHYASQERDILSGNLKASTRNIVLEAPKFEVVYLEMLQKQQIREVLGLRTTAETVEAIMNKPELIDMARRPVLIELILESLSDVQAGKSSTLSNIYYYAIVRKMDRDIKAERTFTSLADKLYFLCEISWEMYSTDRMSLSYKQFPDRIRRYFGSKVAEVEEDHWHYDLLGQTILVRDSDGNYSPGHRSLIEFLVAYKLAAEMGALSNDFLAAARQQSDLIDTIEAQDYTWDNYFDRKMNENEEIEQIFPLNTFQSEDINRLAQTLGTQTLSAAITTLIIDMVEINPIWSILYQTKGKQPSDVKYVGGNAATLLKVKGANFSKKDLSEIVIMKSELSGADFRGTNFSGAILRESNMSGCTLSDANLSNADLSNTVFDDVQDIWSLSWSPDGNYITGASQNGNLFFWEINTNTYNIAKAHSGAALAVSFNYDGKRIASGGSDGNIIIWDTNLRKETIKIEKAHKSVESLCFSPDGQFVASGGSEGKVKVWELNSGALVHSFDGHYGKIEKIDYSNNGDFLISAADDGYIYVWDLKWKKKKWGFSGQIGPLTSVCCGPLYPNIVSASKSGKAQIWSISQGRCLDTFDATNRQVFDVTCSPNGNMVALAGDGIKIWDIKRRKWHTSISPYHGSTLSTSFDPESKFLVTGGKDAVMKIFNVAIDDNYLGKCVRTLQIKMDCTNLIIQNARGLRAETLRFLYDRGARLDLVQREIINEKKNRDSKGLGKSKHNK